MLLSKEVYDYRIKLINTGDLLQSAALPQLLPVSLPLLSQRKDPAKRILILKMTLMILI